MGLLDTLIPKQKNVASSSFKVKIDGSPLDDKYGVSAVMVTKCVNKIPFAQLILLDGDVSKQDYPASSADTFIPGAKVEILMGHGGQDEKTIFKEGFKFSNKKAKSHCGCGKSFNS